MSRIHVFFEEVESWFSHLNPTCPVYLTKASMDDGNGVTSRHLVGAQEEYTTGHVLWVKVNTGHTCYSEKEEWLWKRIMAELSARGFDDVRNAMVACMRNEFQLSADIPEEWLLDMKYEGIDQ